MRLRKYRFLTLLLCFALLISMLPIKSEAYERKDHDDLMLKILFQKYEYACNDSSVQDELSVLTSACYLTIDQFNSYGQNYLDELASYGVKNIPTQVNEIGFSASGRNHRSFTHRGWDFAYSGEMKTKWPLRQDILRNTVGAVFDFNGNEQQKEAFCELLYYIHILGDHEDDASYQISNGLKIDIGGRHDKEDIIHKLLDLLPVLFADQTHTHKYRALTTNLRSINSKLDKLVNSVGGINNDEKFAERQVLVGKVIEILSLYLPKMLKKEPFFNEVFYGEMKQTNALDWLDDLLNAA